MDTREFDALLDGYLEGSLSLERLVAFQDALDGHPALRMEFEAHQDIEKALGAFQAPPAPVSLRDKVMEVVRVEAASQPVQVEKLSLLDMLRTAFGQWQVPAFATACFLGVVAYGVLTHLPIAPTDDALPVRTGSVVVAAVEDIQEDAGASLASPAETAALSLPATEIADASPIESIATLNEIPSFEAKVAAAVATPQQTLAQERSNEHSVPTAPSRVVERETREVATVSEPVSPTEPVQIASAVPRERDVVVPRTTAPRPMPTASPYFRIEASQPPALSREVSASRRTSSDIAPRDTLTITPLPSAPRQASILSDARLADARESRRSSSRTEPSRLDSAHRTSSANTVRFAPSRDEVREASTSRVLTPPTFSSRTRPDRSATSADASASRRIGSTSRSGSRTAASPPSAPAFARSGRDTSSRVASVSAPSSRRVSEASRPTSVAFDSGLAVGESRSHRQVSTRDRATRETRYPSEPNRPTVVFEVYLRSGRSGLSLSDIERRLQKRHVQTLRLKSSPSAGRNASLLNSREKGRSLGGLLCSVRGRDAAWVDKELGSLGIKSAKAWRGLRKPDESKAKGYIAAVRGKGSAPVPGGRSSSSESFVFELHFRHIPAD